MKKSTYQNNVWYLSVPLKPDVYYYKFIVDNNWYYDITKPNQDDGSGNYNNVIHVYETNLVSTVGSPDFRVFFKNGDGINVSPFHDIPLWVDKERGIANMIVEIPKGTRAKLEISKNEALNPIKQDVKNGKLRYVHDPYPFNYGAFPQTWENPNFHDSRTNAKGDNDPIDVCDISATVKPCGSVIQVKILGLYAMIDSGETDWKIVVIDITDPEAEKYIFTNSVVPKKVLNPLFNFLRDYKIPDGNPPNKFAFEDKFLGSQFAVKIVEETHQEWRHLIQKKVVNSNIQLVSAFHH
eukprot:TRINITY_DN18843_c0_g1_i1.p1 TRINITY_DN18843_c0_g1~~TRINITY_DN18843_c0_g1_i1.p1  ORF type:complete len:340 (+),score=67.16 TRINITY_DN18843_c0_g1_i1:136-1020(+)